MRKISSERGVTDTMPFVGGQLESAVFSLILHGEAQAPKNPERSYRQKNLKFMGQFYLVKAP